MSSHPAAVADEPTLVLLRRLGNDQRSLRGQLPRSWQAVRTAHSAEARARAERRLEDLVARLQAKQEELLATAAALPELVRARHRKEVTALLAIYGRKTPAA